MTPNEKRLDAWVRSRARLPITNAHPVGWPARRDDAIDACVYRFERRQQRASNDNARAQ